MKGRADGYDRGRVEGKQAEGKARRKTSRRSGRRVLTILQARGLRVSKTLRQQILACSDPSTLERWLKRAVGRDHRG